MLYKKILVAVDGSEGSFDALRNGIEIARNSGAELTLLYAMNKSVQPAYSSVYPVGMTDPASVREEVKEAQVSEERFGEEILNKAQNRVDPDIKTTTALLHGNPPATICAYAEKNNIDLIVIGNRGHSGLKKLFLGSVSQKVVSDALQPVLVAK
ncbi:universal stress protein [Fictibacillus nanhaiensis]|uniref:universal stress protein n=1 Tax=Fictibacillus nanhaiensis TaxID=742169 RepID=UPI001C97D7C2|nr:universal stress protein [Fictibacillus nanhaiensis]MBY6037622.1 universal stress protein [Fictibacillus nanhaiensis]